MIVERLMKPGSLDIQLVPVTPKEIRDVLLPFGHIVIQEARLDPRVMADADLLSTALYVGVLRRTPNPYKLSGAGTLLWLGDEESKGVQITVGPLTQTFVAWVTSILTAAAVQPVTAGTISAAGAANVTQTFTRMTQRAAMDWLCQYYTGVIGAAVEYRVNNNATLDAGPSTGLFKTTPTAIVMPREGGRDVGSFANPGLTGIPPNIFDLETDADSYTTSVILVGAAGNATANLGVATTYKDQKGNLVQMVRVVQSTQTAAGQEASMAAAQLALYPLRQVITLSTDRYDIPHDVRAGDWLYVYDPEHDLTDLTNEQHYRGQTIHPLKLRISAITWPIEIGMSVYYRDGAGVYTDITPWVQFERPGTTFELGAPVRGLTV